MIGENLKCLHEVATRLRNLSDNFLDLCFNFQGKDEQTINFERLAADDLLFEQCEQITMIIEREDPGLIEELVVNYAYEHQGE